MQVKVQDVCSGDSAVCRQSDAVNQVERGAKRVTTQWVVCCVHTKCSCVPAQHTELGDVFHAGIDEHRTLAIKPMTCLPLPFNTCEVY